MRVPIGQHLSVPIAPPIGLHTTSLIYAPQKYPAQPYLRASHYRGCSRLAAVHAWPGRFLDAARPSWLLAIVIAHAEEPAAAGHRADGVLSNIPMTFLALGFFWAVYFNRRAALFVVPIWQTT